MNTEDAIIAFRSPARRKGYSQVPNVVLLDKRLSDAAKVLYAVLVSYAMQSVGCKVNQADISEDIGKKERTVRTLLSELVQRGLVTVHRQGMMLPNIYFIEDAYALYDSEHPKAKSDRQKTAGHCGQKLPVIAAKNGRLLKNLSPKNNKKNQEVLPSAFQEKPPPFATYKGGAAKIKAAIKAGEKASRVQG